MAWKIQRYKLIHQYAVVAPPLNLLKIAVNALFYLIHLPQKLCSKSIKVAHNSQLAKTYESNEEDKERVYFSKKSINSKINNFY